MFAIAYTKKHLLNASMALGEAATQVAPPAKNQPYRAISKTQATIVKYIDTIFIVLAREFLALEDTQKIMAGHIGRGY